MKIDLTHTLPRFIQLLQSAPGVIDRHVDAAVQEAAVRGARQMKGDTPKNTSELTNSVRNEQVGRAFHRIIADAPHAAYVHDGIGPGSAPPIDILRAWIRTAQIQPRQARDDRDLAYLIQRKIRRDGIAARPFSRPTVTSTVERLNRLIPQAVARAHREVFA